MKLSLAYYLVQLRRIAEHREKGAEREIQRIYQELLKDLQQFLGVEYARLAEDDRLTYEILQSKGEYARFLEEVEQRLNTLTPQASEEIQAVVEAVYGLAYQGMVDAVQKSKTPQALKQLLKGLTGVTPEIVKRAVENPISGLTLKDTLEKNRKEIIYNIKREIGVGLTQGDRMSTMAKRIEKQVDKDYRKAMTITRTEVHRVREGGFLDSAMEIEKTFQQSGSGIRMTKTWGTALDERVRPQRKAYKRKAGAKVRKKYTAGLRSYLGGPNHVKMEGVTVGVEEMFDLGDGVKTAAPGQSGVAGHDINCRCNLEYDLEIPDETVSKKTVDDGDKSGLMKEKESGIIKEIEKIGLTGKPNVPPKPIDTSKLSIDSKHIKDREHNISLDKAISFIHNADLSITKWNGQFENYYSQNGAAFVNLTKNEIRTAFCLDEYDEKVKALMEVIEKWKKK